MGFPAFRRVTKTLNCELPNAGEQAERTWFGKF